MKQPVYAPGTVIAGKYRIDKAIARGGCSIVYRGTHIDMQRAVALKIMTPDAAGDDASWTQRFQREAKLASQLRHPNTITTYDHGHDNGLWYIIMEWVEGASLRNVIKDHGAIEPERCAQLTIQILKSLEEAHRAKILHRDMKPSNIMVTRDVDSCEEFVKVLDFGLAKADPSQLGGDLLKLTRDGDFVGTPRYASPEQLKGRALTNASDIYGVGMIMWEMLTGKPAVPQVDYAVCVEHHLGPRPWTLPPGQFPPGLSMIVEKALNKTQEERYASCQTMREALEGWIELTTGVAGQSFDLFEEIDSLGAGYESEIMGNALDVSSAVFDDELAPTKKNPGVIDPNVGAETSSSFLEDIGLEQSSVSQEKRREPRTDDSLLQAALGLPEREELERLALEERSEPSTPRIADVQRADLKLDMKAVADTRVRSSHHVTPVHQPAQRPAQRVGEAEGSRLIGALFLVVLLALAAGVLWKISFDDTPEPTFQPTGERASSSLAENMGANGVLSRLESKGWEAENQPAKVSIGGLSQTTVRVKRDAMEVDLILYDAPDHTSAHDLMEQARAPTRAHRDGNLVVWMTPVGERGDEVVDELLAVLR